MAGGRAEEEMPKSYEELMGALGRAVFFRPERRRVRDLLSRDAQPQLLVDDNQFPLFDLSMNGVSFVSRNNTPPLPVGTEVEIKLLLYNKQVYTGRGRVARLEPGPKGGTRVGVGLTSGFLDLPEILRQDEEGNLDKELRLGPDYWRTRIPKGFLDAGSRAASFLQFYRQILDRHEARYKAPGGGGHIAISALEDRALEALRGPWNEIQRAASVAAVECLDDPEVLSAAKDFTETLVTPVVSVCPLHRRAYTKPLGYPGDYQVMLYYYDNRLEGESVFARVFHKFGVEHPLSNGVRTRKDLIVDRLVAEHERYLTQEHEAPVFRVASLGCGPAREISDFLKRRKTWPGLIALTLIDQEEEALSIAYHGSHRELQATNGHGSLHCLNLSFIQILRDPALIPMEHQQHFIFATGIFDYLRETTAQALIRGLYDQLAPGGLIALGNAIGPNDYFWSAEFMLDWTMLYRTREEMLRLGKGLPETAELDVIVEPGNAYYFLLVRKH
jgi:extracellular factor (EF) 3-hydroxypalmitic acid methyl ester biosynthesis protein